LPDYQKGQEFAGFTLTFVDMLSPIDNKANYCRSLVSSHPAHNRHKIAARWMVGMRFSPQKAKASRPLKIC